MFFIRDSSREIDGIWIAAVSAVADTQPPKPINLNRIPVRVLQKAKKDARHRIERVDATVAEITYQNVVCICAVGG